MSTKKPNKYLTERSADKKAVRIQSDLMLGIITTSRAKTLASKEWSKVLAVGGTAPKRLCQLFDILNLKQTFSVKEVRIRPRISAADYTFKEAYEDRGGNRKKGGRFKYPNRFKGKQ